MTRQTRHKFLSENLVLSLISKLRILLLIPQKTKHYFKYSSFFGVEIFLAIALLITVGTNLNLKANSKRAENPNQSLLFAYLNTHPELNEKLAQVYQSINVKPSQNHFLPKQILAATTKDATKSTDDSNTAPLPTLSGSTLLKPNPASSTASPISKKDIEVYQVQSGDTLGRIALSYGVSIDTILWENNLASTSYIRPGQELQILPTSGVKHTIQSGETISGVAAKYGVDSEDIFEYNNIEIEDHIFPGEVIIIPNGVKKAPPSPERQEYLASLQKEDYQRVNIPTDYSSGSDAGLIWPLPAAGRISQYYSSRHRAIDVPCRDCDVVAAGDGIVELSGWQSGYGYTIVINHGQGLKTRYAHASKLLISAGDAVISGQTIMISGSTGRSTGPHLHFEINQKGTLLNPLNLVSR